jgi:hypothetical protein
MKWHRVDIGLTPGWCGAGAPLILIRPYVREDGPAGRRAMVDRPESPLVGRGAFSLGGPADRGGTHLIKNWLTW